MFEDFSRADTLRRPLVKWLLLFLAVIFFIATLIFFVDKKKRQMSFVPTDPNQQMAVKDIIAQGHSVSATIEKIDQENKTFAFSTTIADLSDHKKKDIVIPIELQPVAKTYTVRITSRTAFEGKQFADLTAGDIVLITTKESIYDSATLTAKSITYWDEKKEQLNNVLGDPHTLFGSVRSESTMNDISVLTVEAEIPDKEKLLSMDLSGSYVVPYITKTFTISVPTPLIPQESLLGRLVRIKITEDIYESATLKVTEIFLVP